MSERFSLSVLCLLFATVAAVPASAQKTPQAPKPEATPSSQEEQEPLPQPPKRILNVEMKDDLLSVELENVEFSAVIKAVAEKAGFKIEGSGEVFSRKLNTKFTNIEVERGVLRLLTLVKESNYTLFYDTKGSISKLEILGGVTGKAPAVAGRQPLRPASAASSPTSQPVRAAPVPRRRVVPNLPENSPAISRPIAPSPAAAPPSDNAKTQANLNNDEEEPVNEIPYVTPQPKFTPAPARAR